jgi:hypothetical protein
MNDKLVKQMIEQKQQLSPAVLSGKGVEVNDVLPTTLAISLPAIVGDSLGRQVFVKGSWDDWRTPIKLELVKPIDNGQTGMATYCANIELRTYGRPKFSFKFLVRDGGGHDVWMCSPLHKTTHDEFGNENNLVIL